MNLETDYNKNIKNLFCFDTKYMHELRKDLINNFNLNPDKIKNNESLNHFDINILKEFTYNPIDKSDLFPTTIKDYESIININENKHLVLEKIQKYKNSFKDDYLVNLNTIFHNSGFYACFNTNTSNKYFIHNKVKKDQTIFSKNFLQIKPNSNIIIFEQFDNQFKSNTNIVNYFEIEKNSRVLHFVFQENEEDANLQFTNYVNCYEKSFYKQVIFNASKTSIRNHNYANLLGIQSRAELQGIFLGGANNIIDNKTVANHYAPFCTSNQTYKGVLINKAKASHLSKAFVDKVAQKTEAYQLSKGILLSDSARFHSKPELKIFADDVKCSHGSTIGPFEKEILFYMQSRGIKKDEAISLLIQSFFSDIVNSLTQEWWDPDEKNFELLIKNSIKKWLKKNYN